MDITEKIHNAIEWANKRLTLQGQELSQKQKNCLTFALSQDFTDNPQSLQLQQTGVISRLLALKRYETSTGSGWEGSGSVWTELDEDKDGELVKFEDIQIIIDWLNGL